jgi:hypothetical protein
MFREGTAAQMLYSVFIFSNPMGKTSAVLQKIAGSVAV